MAKYQLQQKLANGTMKDIPIKSVNDVNDISVIDDDYTEVDLINKNGDTLAAIPFRKINGESIIGKDPLTISGGGGTSHPVYTEANTDKYTVAKVDNKLLVKFTGESGSRYYFNFDSMEYPATDGCDCLAFKILNNDVKVFAYTSGRALDTFYHEITNTNYLFLYNDGFLSVALTDYAMNSLKWSTHSGRDASMGNSYYANGLMQDNYVAVTNDQSDDIQWLLLTMYKNEVGVLEVMVEHQGDI